MPQVQLEPLRLETLRLLDARIAALFERHVQHVTQDCMNRPGDRTARKIVLEFSVVPVVDQDGQCEHATCEIECRSKVPVFRTKSYPVEVSKAGLRFNRELPEELDQPSLYQDQGDES